MVAADEGGGGTGVALLRGVACGWVFDCAERDVFRDAVDAAFRGAAGVVVHELGAFVDGAGARVLGGYAAREG